MKEPTWKATTASTLIGIASGVGITATQIETLPEGQAFKFTRHSYLEFNAPTSYGDDGNPTAFKTVGRLYYADHRLRFEGDTGISARMFFDDLVNHSNDYCAEIQGESEDGHS